MQFGHDVIIAVLQDYQREYADSNAPGATEEQKAPLDTLKSIVWTTRDPEGS